MQYGKLINGTFKPFTGRYIRCNGRIYTNPTGATLRQLGYKPLVTADMPEEQEGKYIVTVYTESETEIIQLYEYREIETETEAADGYTDNESGA